MASTPSVNVTLSPDLYEYVRKAVKSGRYLDAGEVVRDALRQRRDEAFRELERKIEAGLESARRGDLYDGEAALREIRALSSARRTATKPRK